MICIKDVQLFTPYGRTVYEKHPAGTDVAKADADSKIITGSANIVSKSETWFLRKRGFEEELYVSDKLVVWSQGENFAKRTLINTYSFENSIVQAFWCCFKKDIPVKSLINCVGIFDNERIFHVYEDEGCTYSVTIPFPVSGIWPMEEGGLILQRGLVHSNTNYSAGTSGSNVLPYFFSLNHPLDEVVPMLCRSHATKADYIHDVNRFQIVSTLKNTNMVFVYDGILKANMLFRINVVNQVDINLPPISRLAQSSSSPPPSRDRDSLLHLSKISSSPSYGGASRLSSPLATPPRTNILSPTKNSQISRSSSRHARSPAAIAHSSLCESDQMQCECAVEALMPQFCFEFTWSEASRILEDNKASKAFLCESVFADRYMCYLIPSKNQLRFLKVTLSNKILTVVGGMSTIIAKDAVYVECCKMLIILSSDNALLVYSGQEKIGKIHLLHPELNIYVTGTPNRNVKTTFCPEGDISSVEIEETNLFALPRTSADPSLSDMPQDSSSLESFGTPVYLALRQGVGNKFFIEISKGTLMQAVLPALASSSIVQGCLRCMLETLPTYIYREFVINYYHAANSIGATDDEWSYFMMSFLTNVGYNTTFINSLESIHSSDSLNISHSTKRVRQSGYGADEDWKFLLNSEVNKAFRNYMPHISRLFNLGEESSVMLFQESLPAVIELRPSQNFVRHLPSIFLSLCVYHEELLFNKFLIEDRLELAKLLFIISRCLNLEDAVAYFENVISVQYQHNILAEFNKPVTNIEHQVDFPALFHETEYQFFRWLFNILNNVPYQKVFRFSPEQHKNIYTALKAYAVFWPPEVRHRLLYESTSHAVKNASIIQEIYKLVHDDLTVAKRYQTILEGIDNIFLEKCPRLYILPVFDAVIHAAETSYFDVKSEFYDLIGRHDLVYLQSQQRNSLRLFDNDKLALDHPTADGMDHLMCEHNEWIWKIWPLDLRIREVRACLQSAQPVVIDIRRRHNSSDQEFTLEQEQKLYQLSSRTMSLPIGRGMFTLHTLTMLPTDEVHIPQLNLKGQIPPRNNLIDMSHIETPANMTQWPEFHNGAAAALAIHPDTKGLGNAWFRANVPRNGNKTPDIAGFILGLGLCGRLSDLPAFTVHDLFSSSNEITRIALLLGIGASRHHTKDLWSTRLMTIHVKSMLQPTQTDLEIPFLEQIAAIMSLGLLYAESYDHRIANTLLREIGNLPSIEGEREIIITEREAHNMTAGLAFGMVFLGRGAKNVLLSEWENSLVSTLHDYITGGRRNDRNDRVRGQIREGDRYNQLVTGGPASLALGLMFLNSGMTSIAAIFENAAQQGNVHPDILFYYVLARSLVMWEEITPSFAWVESNVPLKMIDDDIDMHNYFVAIAASCFALGLKYAGLNNIVASKTIMRYVSHFTKLRMNMENYRLYRNSVNNSFDFCIGALLLSESMIMAGTGYIPVLRLVRFLRTLPNIQYFLHMAMHMSLGMVFLGGGRLSLRNGDPFSIACLIASLLPCLPMNSNDNHFHPQYLRHLYVLACEPRLVSFRFAGENMSLFSAHADVTINLANGKSVHLEDKCAVRLPPVELITSMRISSSCTWPIYFETPNHFEHLRRVLQGDGLIMMQYKGVSSDPNPLNAPPIKNMTVEMLPSVVERINAELKYYFQKYNRPVDMNMIQTLKIADLYLNQIKKLDHAEPRFYNLSLLVQLKNSFERFLISKFQELRNSNGSYTGSDPMVLNGTNNLLVWFNIFDTEIISELRKDPSTLTKQGLIDHLRRFGIPSYIALIIISAIFQKCV